MKPYVVLLRGINVGGKNKILMTELRNCLEKLGFLHVTTYIASGNVILSSSKSPTEIKSLIETTLIKDFKLDSKLIKVLVLSRAQLQSIVDSKPKGFGDQPDIYHSDVIFLIELSVTKAMAVFNPREGVDMIWSGAGIIYSQRLSSLRTKSRLSKIIGTLAYQSMTIRNWNTVITLLRMIKELDRLNNS